jgi:hypothetical protein
MSIIFLDKESHSDLIYNNFIHDEHGELRCELYNLPLFEIFARCVGDKDIKPLTEKRPVVVRHEFRNSDDSLNRCSWWDAVEYDYSVSCPYVTKKFLSKNVDRVRRWLGR